MHPDNFKFVFVSKEANDIANRLTTEHQISKGYGIASYLGLDPNYDNFSAVRLWVHKKLTNWPPEYLTALELNRAFTRCFPPQI